MKTNKKEALRLTKKTVVKHGATPTTQRYTMEAPPTTNRTSTETVITCHQRQ
jgi:hypothetical protein